MSPFHRQENKSQAQTAGNFSISWKLASHLLARQCQGAASTLCQCLPEGLKWVQQPFSFQMLPAYPEQEAMLKRKADVRAQARRVSRWS